VYGERLGAAEMLWEDTGKALGGAKSLELRIARRWNERVSHYDNSQTGRSIRNIREGRTL